MKEKELNELLDKAIGTKGNLRIPAYWMRKVFSGLMEWCKGLLAAIRKEINEKQPLLKSGDNIKTINGEDIVGKGDIAITVENSYAQAVDELRMNGGGLLVRVNKESATQIETTIYTDDNYYKISTESSPKYVAIPYQHQIGQENYTKGGQAIAGLDFTFAPKYFSRTYQSIFANTKITCLDVSKLDFSSVTSMDCFFADCKDIYEIDLSGVNLSNVTSMYEMFAVKTSPYANNLKVIRLPYMRPTDMRRAFNMLSLKELYMPEMDLSSIYSASYLPNIDFSNIETLVLGPNFFKGNYLITNFSQATYWRGYSVRLSLVDNLYDRVANGITTPVTIKLSSSTKNFITEEDLLTINAKGYVIE